MSQESDALLDISEKGMQDGQPTTLDRRLFVQFIALGGCRDVRPVISALGESGAEAALYLELCDPGGIGIVALAEDPEYFVNEWRSLLQTPPLASLQHHRRLDMCGRTYAIGYEPDLEEALLGRPRARILDPTNAWAVWYPLQRSKAFYTLPQQRRTQILREHGAVGRRFGAAGLATDIRLACHGLDREDNDFVIGLLGRQLHPLSAVVQEMRSTEQTSHYLERLGPFFIGRKVWQSPRS